MYLVLVYVKSSIVFLQPFVNLPVSPHSVLNPLSPKEETAINKDLGGGWQWSPSFLNLILLSYLSYILTTIYPTLIFHWFHGSCIQSFPINTFCPTFMVSFATLTRKTSSFWSPSCPGAKNLSLPIMVTSLIRRNYQETPAMANQCDPYDDLWFAKCQRQFPSVRPFWKHADSFIMDV